MAWILYAGMALAAVYFVTGVVSGGLLVRQFAFSRNSPVQQTMDGGLERGEFGHDFLDRYKIPFTVPGPEGYALRGVYVPGKEAAPEGGSPQTEKTIIFVHGHTSTWVGMGKYMNLFLKRGWNVIAYSQRHHGDSGGPNTTGGFREKGDLKAVADWAWKQFPQTEVFGVYGESLGAATVLQYLPLDDRLTFAAADCPYSDAAELFRHQLKLNHIPFFLRPFAMACGGLLMRTFAGFRMADVSPKRDILRTEVPLLLIHGGADTYVPTRMSQEMYQLRKEKAPTVLHLMPEAKHAVSIQQDPELYEAWLKEFMETFVLTGTF